MKKGSVSGLLNGFIALLVVMLTAQWAVASDGSGAWRPAYDLALRWINFGILLFLILKYARKPLVNFFREKSEDIRKDIQEIEKEKEKILLKIGEIRDARDQSQQKLEELKERIINQGKLKKQSIIDNAQEESKILLKSAQHKMQSQVLSAQERIRAELIDTAIDMAMQKLPGEIKEQDNQKFYDLYLDSTQNLSKE